MIMILGRTFHDAHNYNIGIVLDTRIVLNLWYLHLEHSPFFENDHCLNIKYQVLVALLEFSNGSLDTVSGIVDLNCYFLDNGCN